MAELRALQQWSVQACCGGALQSPGAPLAPPPSPLPVCAHSAQRWTPERRPDLTHSCTRAQLSPLLHSHWPRSDREANKAEAALDPIDLSAGLHRGASVTSAPGLPFPRAGLECQTWIDRLENAAGKFGTVGLSQFSGLFFFLFGFCRSFSVSSPKKQEIGVLQNWHIDLTEKKELLVSDHLELKFEILRKWKWPQ